MTTRPNRSMGLAAPCAIGAAARDRRCRMVQRADVVVLTPAAPVRMHLERLVNGRLGHFYVAVDALARCWFRGFGREGLCCGRRLGGGSRELAPGRPSWMPPMWTPPRAYQSINRDCRNYDR